jgi:hypothetical protein
MKDIKTMADGIDGSSGSGRGMWELDGAGSG